MKVRLRRALLCACVVGLLGCVHDEARLDFPDRLEEHGPILTRVLEAIERFPHFGLEIPIAGRELIAEHMEERKIDLVGAMRIG